MLGRMSPGSGLLPSFMVKLFWKRMDEAAEGVGGGGGAEHEGGGEGAPRVMVEYSYEEEEKIEEDTSRQAQHGVSGPGGNVNEQEGWSSESSSGMSSSDESIEHDGEGAGEHPDGMERTEEHGVALGERVDEQQATGDDGAVEEQEGGAAAQEGGAGVLQQEGGAAVQDFGTGVQQQKGEAAALEGGVGGQQQEGVVAAQEAQVVELLQRVAKVEASQKKLVADVFAKHSEQAAIFNKLAGDFWTAWNMISELSKSMLKQCGDAVNGVTEGRKLLEGARTKLDEMSGKTIEGVAAAITKASEDAVEKQFKLVEERLVASVLKGIEKAVKEDLFYSTLLPESMKELKDVRGAPTPSGGAMGKGAGEKWGAPSQVVDAAGLLSKTKTDSAAQLGIVDRPVEPVGKRPSSFLGNICLSKLGSPPPGPRPRSPSASKKRHVVTKSTKRAAEATESSDMVELGSLLGQAHVEKASTAVAARHEKSNKPKVIVYAPPPPPDDQGKRRGCKAPFKELGMMSRKGKTVSEQTVGSRKRFLGTFKREADQKFCTAICWHVYFPDIDLKEYEGFTAQDEKDWKVYLDTAVRMPTRVWSVAQEQGECRFDDFLSLLATANTEVRAGTDWGIALCGAIGKVATLGQRHGNVIYLVLKNMHGTAHMMAVAATVASLWAGCRKLSREDIKKDALAAANAALYTPEMATRASAAAIAALLSVLLHIGKTFPGKQWPDLLYSSAVEGLGSTDATLLQMVCVAAQVCTQWCCCRFAARLLEDTGYGSLAMPEEKSKAKMGDEDATEAETGGQGE
ncbi:unnamed protein product [Closterium sp. NIES-54]